MQSFVFLAIALTMVSCSVQNKLNGPLQAGWLEKKVCIKLHENKYERFLRCTFPPGVGHEKHRHNKNFGYAISGGTMQISDSKGSREVTLKTNSYFKSEGTNWHEVLNIGKTTVVYLIVERK